MTSQSDRKDNYSCLPQFLSALAVGLGASVVGGWISFTSVAIPKMMRDNNTANLREDLSYFTSVAKLSLIIDPMTPNFY